MTGPRPPTTPASTSGSPALELSARLLPTLWFDGSIICSYSDWSSSAVVAQSWLSEGRVAPAELPSSNGSLINCGEGRPNSNVFLGVSSSPESSLKTAITGVEACSGSTFGASSPGMRLIASRERLGRTGRCGAAGEASEGPGRWSIGDRELHGLPGTRFRYTFSPGRGRSSWEGPAAPLSSYAGDRRSSGQSRASLLEARGLPS